MAYLPFAERDEVRLSIYRQLKLLLNDFLKEFTLNLINIYPLTCSFQSIFRKLGHRDQSTNFGISFHAELF